MPDQRQFRDTMGLFATGVAVIAVPAGEEVQAMTANAVSSLSLDPLLLLFCPAKKAHLSQHLAPNVPFSVNLFRGSLARGAAAGVPFRARGCDPEARRLPRFAPLLGTQHQRWRRSLGGGRQRARPAAGPGPAPAAAVLPGALRAARSQHRRRGP